MGKGHSHLDSRRAHIKQGGAGYMLVILKDSFDSDMHLRANVELHLEAKTFGAPAKRSSPRSRGTLTASSNHGNSIQSE